jgi:hypothetical protein
VHGVDLDIHLPLVDLDNLSGPDRARTVKTFHAIADRQPQYPRGVTGFGVGQPEHSLAQSGQIKSRR